MTSRTRTEILDEVQELADQVLEAAPEMTVAEATAFVWEEADGLYDEYTAAPLELPMEPVAKSDPEPTVAEVIMKAVGDRAAQMAWTQWPHKSLADLELEVWSTSGGEQLYELYRSADGRLPYSQARQRITKRADGPWGILDAWLSQ